MFIAAGTGFVFGAPQEREIHNDTRSYKFRLYEAIRSARVSEIPKGENSYGHGKKDSDRTPTGTCRRQEDSAAAELVRRRDGSGQEGAGERNQRVVVAGFGTAAANRKRRPGRGSSRQEIRVDHHCSVSAWRREAASHIPPIAGRQPFTRCEQGRHPA